jgi:hypothetical protein
VAIGFDKASATIKPLEGTVMQVRLFLCSESNAIDARTNRISAFHIIDEMVAAAFPAVMPQMTVLANLDRAPDETQTPELHLQIQAENSESLLRSHPITVNFQGALRTRSITVVQGLVIPAPLTLHVTLIHGGEEIARWTIPVVETGQPTSSRTEPPSVSAEP